MVKHAMKSFMTSFYICFVKLYANVWNKFRCFTPSAPFYINCLYDPKIERIQSFKIYSRFVLKLFWLFFMQTFKNFYDIGNIVKLSYGRFRKYVVPRLYRILSPTNVGLKNPEVTSRKL